MVICIFIQRKLGGVVEKKKFFRILRKVKFEKLGLKKLLLLSILNNRSNEF